MVVMVMMMVVIIIVAALCRVPSVCQHFPHRDFFNSHKGPTSSTI